MGWHVPGARRWVLAAVVPTTALTVLAGCTVPSASSPPSGSTSSTSEEGAAGQQATLVADSGPPWASGVWLGGATDASEFEEFGRWRGAQVDTLTTYPAYETWQELSESDWHVLTFDGFAGRLVYGLPLLPSDEPATLREVADGLHDDVWRSVAAHLVDNGRADSFVRVGLEANGTWFPWGATAETAEDYRAAYRHVVEILREAAPDLEFVFDLSCGVALEGGDDRLDALVELYPGDDVVDVIGCDHYDSYTAVARTADEWLDSSRPETGPGLTDVVEFARARGKQFAVPEWGLTAPTSEGGGDNPFFILQMYNFFQANRDVLAFENYFDEPDDYLGSAIFLEPQNPLAGNVYRALW